MKFEATGTCFDDTCEYLEDLARAGTLTKRELLCHAICEAPDGHHYSHAWVEEDDEVIFTCLIDGQRGQVWVDRAAYYAEMKVLKVTKYTMQQTMAENLKHKTNGPWLDEYRALCKKSTQPKERDMTCESCEHTMQQVSSEAAIGRIAWWCPRCGTLKIKAGANEETTIPRYQSAAYRVHVNALSHQAEVLQLVETCPSEEAAQAWIAKARERQCLIAMRQPGVGRPYIHLMERTTAALDPPPARKEEGKS